MKLERIKIEGYRSLKSVEWKPEPLNVLIGANATGKSNFLQALELLPAAAEGTLEQTILDRGGMAPLMWDGVASKICLSSSFKLGSYTLTLSRVPKTGAFEITDERVVSPSGAELITRSWAELANALEPSEAMLSSRLDPNETPEARSIQQALSGWSLHHDLPTDQTAPVRRSSVTRSKNRLARTGEDLTPVLHTLYEQSREFENAVDDAMTAAFPNDYDKLKFESSLDRGHISVAVRWRGARRQPDASELSDGTLRFLMLLAILANPDPPPLIAIDEPETGLHPRMLSIVAEYAVMASRGSQVILSTHSPVFLDAFEDTKPAVTVFEWEQDHTVMGAIEGEQLQRWLEDYTLGNFAFSGGAEAIS
jgi:predicted ATPase